MPDTEQEKDARWQFTLVEKIVGTVLIGLLGWMAVTVQQVSVDVAVMKAQFADATADRFRMQDGKRLEDKIERNEERLRVLEQRAGIVKD